MHAIEEHNLLLALIALAVILGIGRWMGDMARRLGQPEVLGQLIAGFLLGPSVFGALLPGVRAALFGNAEVGTALSLFSWVGAILLLLIAGMEVDLRILRQEAKPGLMAAAFAIATSLIAGTLFGHFVIGSASGFFLGIVLTVTAVSVTSKILIERGEMRRRYGQVALAAGVASEVFVWFLVAIAAATGGSSPVLAGARSAVFAVLFFALMVTLGRRVVAWAMRAVVDFSPVAYAQLSLVLMLGFLSAVATQALGLHPLLGAFTFGVLLTRMPRANPHLAERIEAPTFGLFGPIFFVLAGMRVDIFKLAGPSALLTVFALLAVATAVKVGFGTLGAKLGGMRGWEAGLIGVGLNLKGGTDVIVAIIGSQAGLLSAQGYTMYAVVSIITVLISPPVMSWLAGKTPPTGDEQERLEREEARRRSYVPGLERVLLPSAPDLRPEMAASVLQTIAAVKQDQCELMDIVEVEVRGAPQPQQEPALARADQRLADIEDLNAATVTKRTIAEPDTVAALLRAAKDDDLIAVGATPPHPGPTLSLGPIQDAVIDQARPDVLVAVDHEDNSFDPEAVQRILVASNGLEYSMAAGDVAGYLAKGCDAEITVLSVVRSSTQAAGGEHDRVIQEVGGSHTQELLFRLHRLGVRARGKVDIAADPAEAILQELRGDEYQLVVLGCIDRSLAGRVFLGETVQTVLTRTDTPALVLVVRE